VVGNQCFGGCAASIFRVEVHDHGDVFIALLPTKDSMASETLVFSHPTWHNNPENHNFYSPP